MEEARRRDYAADYLIRAKHNRKLVGGEKLWDSVASQEPLGHIEFILEATSQRKARKVRQTLYTQRVTLPKKKGKPALEVTILLAQEETPPAGEKAIVWRLLTNRTVETFEQASKMIDWYRRRWLIEIYFRILKSGCRVESLQLSSVERLERAIMIYLIIGWRILHVVTTG
jgi:IS4 transposase